MRRRDNIEIPDYWGRLESPAAVGARAQLLLALLLGALLPVFLLALPIPTHALKIDLPYLPETVGPMVPGGAPPAFILTTILLPDMALEPPRRLHSLVITAGNKVLMNGREVDLADLRMRLKIVIIRDEWVDFRPDPNARYETFAEVLAVTKRSRLERMRLDSSPFRQAIDPR